MKNVLAALLLMAAFLLPVQAVVPDPDSACDGGEPPGVQCNVVAGPLTLTLKGLVTTGVATCQDESPAVPLFCAGIPGDINGFGGQSFGDPLWVGPQLIDVNVVNDQGMCTDATSPPCGFTVDICNDTDQDFVCTNTFDVDDDLYETAASQGVLGTCKDVAKGCADPNEAGWSGCMDDSIFGTWSANQIIVFVGAEADTDPSPADVQAAASTGTYTIWVENLGPCVVLSPSTEDESTLLVWEPV